MPLGLLLGLVVGGIAAIALLLHLLGLSRPLRLTEDAARAAWVRHFPDDDVHRIILAQNGQAALIGADHRLGLLWSFGSDTVARYFPAARVETANGNLIVCFPDYTAPVVRLRLTKPECQRWQQWINAA